MTAPDADELRMLRQRAYGPSADIHLDPDAVERLRELEATGRQRPATVTAESAEEPQGAAPGATPERNPPVTDAAVPEGREPDRPRLRIRPLTAVLLVAVIVLSAAAWLAVTLVQRVQSSPLQPDARQIARLAQDDGYDIPESFSAGPDGSRPGRAFQEFYGLRAVINGFTFTPEGEAEDDCIVVYAQNGVTEEPGAFAGPAWGGCAAGRFPASVAFRISGDLPQELRDAYPEGTALQFVLDESSNEVVIFADQ